MPPASSNRVRDQRAPRRFVFVDALRGLAAMWVVVFHAFAGSHLEHLAPALPAFVLGVIQAGFRGVVIFFVLSGFVIAHSVRGRHVSGSYIKSFAIRRSLRLDPPYWVSLAILWTYLHHLYVRGRAAEVPSVLDMLAHVFYLQDLLRITPLSPVYWTLCIEMQLYLVFIVLLGLAHRLRAGSSDRRPQLAIFTVAAVIAAAWPTGLAYEGPFLKALFLPRWYMFLLGAWAYWAVRGTLLRLAFYVYATTLLAFAWRGHHWDAVTAVGTAVLLLEGRRADKLGEWLNWRPLQFLGTISYSLYLFHGPIAIVTNYFTQRLYTSGSAAAEFAYLAVLLTTSCLGAFVFWRLLEAPCIAVSRQWKT